MSKFYPATSLTGGGTGSLDSIDGDLLADGDGALVITDGTTYNYHLDASSGAAENSPSIISPDSNPGNKRWTLQTNNVEALRVNEDMADVDTQFSGDGEANLLYLDAGNDRIGVGTATPGVNVDVSSATGTNVRSIATGANSEAILQVQNDARGWQMKVTTDDSWRLRDNTGAVDVISIASAIAATAFTLEADGDALFAQKVGIGVTPSFPLHIQKAGAVEVRMYSTDNDMSLQLASDTDEGQDSILAFNSAATTRGSITYDHNPAAASQSMIFKVGDNAVTAVTLEGDGDMFLASGNKLGVGVTPTVALQVQVSNSGYAAIIENTHDTNGSGLKVIAGDDNTPQALLVQGDGGAPNLFDVRGAGQIFMPAYGNGDAQFINGTGEVSSVSDEDAKEFHGTLDSATAILTQFPDPQRFTMKSDPEQAMQYGWGAQWIHEVFPEAAPKTVHTRYKTKRTEVKKATALHKVTRRRQVVVPDDTDIAYKYDEQTGTFNEREVAKTEAQEVEVWEAKDGYEIDAATGKFIKVEQTSEIEEQKELWGLYKHSTVALLVQGFKELERRVVDQEVLIDAHKTLIQDLYNQINA